MQTPSQHHPTSEKIAAPVGIGETDFSEDKDYVHHRENLLTRVQAYNPSADLDILRRAYDFCRKAHEGQYRKSGEPYYTHPIAVCAILADLKLDTATLCTALLHDTVEDTDVTDEDIRNLFGREVEELVKGVTKLSGLELSSRRTEQAENLQKFIAAISKDMRVLLVKLADRFHNMRTLHHVPSSEKREKKARETLEIYAPLARKIGVHRLCSELEELSFEHINPSAHQSITRRLKEVRKTRSKTVAHVSQTLAQALEKAGFTTRVFGREKRPYSIWRKLERKAIDFTDLADIYAFRVLVETADDCYRALGLIHQSWRCVPLRFKDYISTQKPNGYRSLHTTIMGPDNFRVELQIRTEEMERIAEDGVAAHWRYKNHHYAYDSEAAEAAGGDPFERLRPLVEILEHGGDPDEFLEHAKLEMFSDQVFAFTPKGDLIALPFGATPLDFAYAVHTRVGDTCVGAFINGRERPLRTRLENGDVVDIIRGGASALNPGWEDMVVTGRARSAIRRLIRRSEREEFIRLGKSMARRAFRRNGKGLEGLDLSDALARLGFSEDRDLFENMGRGHLSGQALFDSVFPGHKRDEKFPHEVIRDETASLYVRGQGLTPGITLHFARCCSPLPGDRIVGLFAPKHGVDIHTIDCDRLELYEQEQENWLDLGWTVLAKHDVLSVGRIEASVEHTPGALAELAKLVGENKGNMTNIYTMRRSPDFFDMTFDIEVRDARHLSQIIAAFRASPFVASAQRARFKTEKIDEN